MMVVFTNFFRKATTTASSETLQVNEDEVAVAVGKTSESPTQLTRTMDQEECSITTYISGQLQFFLLLILIANQATNMRHWFCSTTMFLGL